MSTTFILIVFLFFATLGRIISQPRRHSYPPQQPFYGHYPPSFLSEEEIETRINRKAFVMALLFVALLATAMYLAHDVFFSETIVATK